MDGKNRQIVWTWLRDNLTNDFKLIGKVPEMLDTYKMFPSNPY